MEYHRCVIFKKLKREEVEISLNKIVIETIVLMAVINKQHSEY
jgi:hypothetical protein